jgi:phospholipid-binding lipoprotein MlaA
MRHLKALVAAALAALPLAACATTPASMMAAGENDPFESWNRGVFDFTIKLDKAVFRPVAVAYRDVLPGGIRDSIRNFLNNLDSPVILANDVLQGEANRAGITLGRAVVNTTIGVGGLFDVAQVWGLPRHSEDFGQTLAVWGVESGPYLFLPVIGPGNPRDLIGTGVDWIFDPFTWWQFPNRYWVQAGRTGIDFLDLRARNIDTLDEIEKSSLDYYASVRSLYRQTRENEIRNGASEVQNLPEF